MTQERKDNREDNQPHGHNRLAEQDELSLAADEHVQRSGDKLPKTEIERKQPPKRAREAGLTGASVPGGGLTDDDFSRETLIDEDGARSPSEPGGNTPLDKELTDAGEDEIGAAGGLDQAELGRKDPLDGEPWDGDPTEPLTPRQTAETGFIAENKRQNTPD